MTPLQEFLSHFFVYHFCGSTGDPVFELRKYIKEMFKPHLQNYLPQMLEINFIALSSGSLLNLFKEDLRV